MNLSVFRSSKLGGASAEPHQLWSIETASLLGSVAWRPTFRENGHVSRFKETFALTNREPDKVSFTLLKKPQGKHAVRFFGVQLGEVLKRLSGHDQCNQHL